MKVPFSFLKSAGNAWPYPLSTGGVTDLIISSGQSVVLDAGGVYGYNSIFVQAGGYLVINNDTGLGWTIVAAKTSFVVNGSIHANRGYHDGSSTKTLVAPDGKTLSAAIHQANGGYSYDSHPSGNGSYPGLVGAGSIYGHGAGGSMGGNSTGQGVGKLPSLHKGGSGGYSGTIQALGGDRGMPGFTGNIPYTNPGGTGMAGTRTGEGGGGGGAGHHGSYLYLPCAAQITGTGYIYLNGSHGGVGGNGIAGNSTIGNGSGGGGGAGGSGGHLRYRTTGISGSITVLTNPGNGGLGGVGIGGTRSPGGQQGYFGSSSAV